MSEDNKNEDTKIVLKDSEGNEKNYTAGDVETLLKTNTELSGKIAGAEGFNKTLDKYGTDQETYLNNAEAAFGVMSELIEKGLIDEQGNVVAKKEDGKTGDAGAKGNEDDFLKSLGFGSDDKGGGDSQSKTLQIVSKVVDTKLGGLVKQIEELSSGQAGLYRAQLKSTIQAKHSSFTDNDVSRLFGIASANPGKDLWAHADELAKKKGDNSKKTREHFAKEFGVNLDEFDANKLNEQDSKGGGTIAALKGKKFVFPSRAKRLGLKDVVSPREAMVSHLKAKGGNK